MEMPKKGGPQYRSPYTVLISESLIWYSKHVLYEYLCVLMGFSPKRYLS